MAEARKLKAFSWGPYGDRAGFLRSFLVAVIAGGFLAFSGAFGMDDMTLARRFAYWIPLMAAGTLWGSAAARLVFGADPDGSRMIARILAAGLLIGIPFTGVVWITNNLFMGSQIGPRQALSLCVTVTIVSVVMVAINALVARGDRPRLAPPPAPPRFLERLPLKLRGAEVWAVESEDHYLRLHTSKGQDLILLRLADAVAELEGIEGTQVHRSWWVARDAIADARRGDGRATLTLKDGSEVPVSRTYAKIIREKGWI